MLETSLHGRQIFKFFKKQRVAAGNERGGVLSGEKSNKFTQVTSVLCRLCPVLSCIALESRLLVVSSEAEYTVHFVQQHIRTGSQPGLSGCVWVVFWYRLAG